MCTAFSQFKFFLAPQWAICIYIYMYINIHIYILYCLSLRFSLRVQRADGGDRDDAPGRGHRVPGKKGHKASEV